MISSFITESPDYYTQGDIGPIVRKISSVKKSKISIIMLAGSLGVDITEKLDVNLNYVLREWIKKDSAPLKSKTYHWTSADRRIQTSRKVNTIGIFISDSDSYTEL